MQPDSPYKPPSTIEHQTPHQADPYAALTLKQILFSFKGRIPRRVLWLWGLISVLAFIVPLGFLAPLFQREDIARTIATVVTIPLAVAFIWVSLALRIKRWHDHGKSGLWILIGIIPYVGLLISFIFLGCMRGTVSRNQYGPDPT